MKQQYLYLFMALILTIFFVSCNSNENIETTLAPIVDESSADNYEEAPLLTESVIREQIYSFPWIFEDKKPFLSSNGNGLTYSVVVADINLDGINEIIITDIYSPRDIPPSEVFAFIDGELVSIGGFWGFLGDDYNDSNFDLNAGSLPLYKTSDGKKVFIQWTRASHSGTDIITYSEVTLSPITYFPLASCSVPYDGQSTKTVYYEIIDFDDLNSLHSVLLLDGASDPAVAKEISLDQYNDILVNHKSSLIQTGEIHFSCSINYNKYYNYLTNNPGNLTLDEYISELEHTNEILNANYEIAKQIFGVYFSE